MKSVINKYVITAKPKEIRNGETEMKEKIEISKLGLIDVCGRIASAATEPGDKIKGMADASIEMVKIINELFPEKEEKEEKENKAEELNDLEKLLFRRTYLAYAQYHTTISAVSLSRYTNLRSLIIDAGLNEKYNLWKAAHEYE